MKSLGMSYEQFITEVQKYWDLRQKGLKKQANKFLFAFTNHFKEHVSDSDADLILFQFCREYIDELKFPGDHLPRLWWGQHHFPEGCIITQEAFHHTVCTADRILSEKKVDPELVSSFEYYVKLYHIYFDWQAKGRVGCFYEQCKMEGIGYKGIPTFYYEK